MFSEMIATIRKNRLPDADILRKRFDYAMTKKLGILNLPPPFWMQDPKINPPAAELFWASLLLKDRERIDLALSVIAAELDNNTRSKSKDHGADVSKHTDQLISELLNLFTDEQMRNKLRQDLTLIIPEILGNRIEGECCE